MERPEATTRSFGNSTPGGRTAKPASRPLAPSVGLCDTALMSDYPPFLVVGTPPPEVLDPIIRGLQLHGEVTHWETGAGAQKELHYAGALSVVVDARLEDMSGWDLCGWIRARWRDLPLMVIGHEEIDLAAVYLEPNGALWTIPDALRERMTDLSVLHDDPSAEPVPPTEAVANALGVSVAEVEADLRASLRELKYDDVGEMRFHMRNAPHNLDELAAPVRVRFEPGPIVQA